MKGDEMLDWQGKPLTPEDILRGKQAVLAAPLNYATLGLLLDLFENDLGVERSIRFDYVNHRGEASRRTAVLLDRPRYGATKHHPAPCWTVLAYCVDKQAERHFAVAEMANIEDVTP